MLIDTSSNIVDLKLFAIATYDKEKNTILLEWNTTIPKGNFNIKVSTDGINFTTASVVTDSINYEYKIMDNSNKYYFKIKQTTSNGKTVESNTVTMVKNENGYELNLEDTDKDGLPDVYENMICTDPLKPDTDGDGLNDYTETNLTNTNPLKIDTNENTVSDANEDLDSDSLINLQEIKYGSNPLVADTDLDDLNDGDELNKYKTNPLIGDTDEDSISDGDEIKLGLNPLSKYTNEGVLDSEIQFNQKIESTDIPKINTLENEYEVSLDVTASGYVNSNLNVIESTYASALSANSAIKGVPIELNYESGDVEKATIKFKLKDSLLTKANEVGAKALIGTSKLERFHIFRYDEKNDFLYPVKTQEDGDTIYTQTNKLGTYCVMDLVEWDKSLQDNSQPQTLSMLNADDEAKLALMVQEQVKVTTEPIIEIAITQDELQQQIQLYEKLFQESVDEMLAFDAQDDVNMSSRSIAPENRKKIDIVFAIDSTGSMAEPPELGGTHFVNSCCSQSIFFITKLIVSMNKANIDWRICLVDFKKYPNDGDNARTIYAAPDGSPWFSKATITDLGKAMREIQDKTKVAKETTQTPWDALGYITQELTFRDGTVRQAVLMSNQIAKDVNRYNIKDINEMSELLLQKGIITHYVTHMDAIDNYSLLREKTKGVYAFYFYDFINDFPQIVVDYIVGARPLPIDKQPKVVTSCGLEKIDVSKLFGTHLEEDLDGDSLKNKDEIRTDLMNGNISLENLITLKEFGEKIDKSTIDGFTKELLQKHANTLVLPLKSDPRKKDSDGDKYNDDIDAYPLSYIVNMSYIFYEKGGDDFLKDEALHREKKIKKNSEKVSVLPTNSLTEFCDYWNNMGVNAEGKVEYEISDVYTVFHGGPDFIWFGKDVTLETTDLNLLHNKKIGVLHLSSCNNGNLDYLNFGEWGGENFKQNMAISFLKTCSGIKTVKASDGFASYFIGLDISTGYTDFWELIRFSKSKFDRWSLAKNGRIRMATGFITYTRDDNGEIVFSPKIKIYDQDQSEFEIEVINEVIK
ncbi:MAG: hypothetical protein WAX04_10920 [Oscillospiraceae bacterium]